MNNLDKETCDYCGGNCPNEPEDSKYLCDEYAAGGFEENTMITIEREGHVSTFDIIADDGNFPLLITVTKAIKAEKGMSLNLAHTVGE